MMVSSTMRNDCWWHFKVVALKCHWLWASVKADDDIETILWFEQAGKDDFGANLVPLIVATYLGELGLLHPELGVVNTHVQQSEESMQSWVFREGTWTRRGNQYCTVLHCILH